MEIEFPIIADLDMKVATAYGMVHPVQQILQRFVQRL